MKYIITLLAVFAFGQIGSAQWCGTDQSPESIARLLENKNIYYTTESKERSQVDIYVPIKFHLVADQNGEGRIEEYKVFNELCNLNDAYNKHGIYFFKQGGFNYINNKTLYEDPSSNGPAMSANKTAFGNSALNIFITLSAQSPNGQGTTLGYYSPFYDVVVIKKDQIGVFNGTVPHEVGHFFSLAHTFLGWESEAYDPAVHGNPLNSLISPDGLISELMDGSNCEIAGDYLCDTNPDYNFGFGWSGCSEYTIQVKDFNGDLIDVDEENFMGYFIGCDDYHFSLLQVEMMKTDHASPDRDYLQTSVTVSGESTFGNIMYSSPDEDEFVESYNYVEVEWNSIPNATKYYVEVSLKNGADQRMYSTGSTKYVIKDLDPDKPYKFKVAAVNDYPGCAVIGNTRFFNTGNLLSASDVEEFGITIRPNILQVNDGFVVNSPSTMNVQMYISNVTGQRNKITTNQLVKGDNEIMLPSNLGSGIHFIAIESEGKIQTSKLIIQ